MQACPESALTCAESALAYIEAALTYAETALTYAETALAYAASALANAARRLWVKVSDTEFLALFFFEKNKAKNSVSDTLFAFSVLKDDEVGNFVVFGRDRSFLLLSSPYGC